MPRTKRQKEVLEYIIEFADDHGYAPSYQQIALHFGVKSKGGIARHVEALEKQGFVLRRHDSSGFHLELTSEISLGDSVCKIEWLKLPEISDNKKPDTFDLFVPIMLLKTHPPEKIQAFRVFDNSMEDEHICEGDIALIEKRSFVRDRDSIVAIIDGQKAVLRNLFRHGAEIELRPANSEFENVTLSGDRIEILGVLRGLLRPSNY